MTAGVTKTNTYLDKMDATSNDISKVLPVILEQLKAEKESTPDEEETVLDPVQVSPNVLSCWASTCIIQCCLLAAW